jgi:hypothetical protein
VSPRKSSTSSGSDNSFLRPRYLSVEVAGDLPYAGRLIERELLRRLEVAGVHRPTVRMIRWEGTRGLVRVPHTDARRARQVWNGTSRSPDGSVLTLKTGRSYGTLRKGKAWIRAALQRSTRSPS